MKMELLTSDACPFYSLPGISYLYTEQYINLIIMRQNSIYQFYFAIIMAIFLVGCEKDNLAEVNLQEGKLSLDQAKTYFEQCFISGSLTKSGVNNAVNDKLFYPGDFTPQWDKATYS